ncbi:MAG: DUF4402 domain-containing protein [Bacteroidales bacterium]
MKQRNTKKWLVRWLFIATTVLACASNSFAQPDLPPRSLTVTATQAIHFGTFWVGATGGDVIVGWDGSRSSTGDVVLLAMAPLAQPAIFEVKLCHGRNVIITFSPTTLLTNGTGGSLTLEIGPTEQGGNNASFITNNDCNFITPLRVGGTLAIPGSSPSGTYSGSFDITFNHE